MKYFSTGVEELDGILGEDRISSDELTELCGCSGMGKTQFCMKFAALALIEGSAIIYIDTTNYINNENISLVLKNHIPEGTPEEKSKKSKEYLGRLKVIKIHDAEELIVFLAKILSIIANK